MKVSKELLMISRPGFWPTHLWFYMIPFAGRNMFANPNFWLGAIYFCFPFSLFLYGWNDVGDHKSDAANPRKNNMLFGGRPNEKMRRRLPLLIALIQIPFLLYFMVHSSWMILLVFLAMVITNMTYNTLRFKEKFGLDLINQAGYALMLVFACVLCSVPLPPTSVVVFCIMFAVHSHLFGQVIDFDEDKTSGRKSTVVTLGIFPSKIFISMVLLLEGCIGYYWMGSPLIGLLSVLGAIFFLVESLMVQKKYSLLFVKNVFYAWNVFVILSMFFIWKYDVFKVLSL